MTTEHKRTTKSKLERRVREREATISIVGAGRMGTALALALSSCGYKIEAIVARRKLQAQRAAGLIEGVQPLALTTGQFDQIPDSDILFITTPDDGIESVADQLARVYTRRHARRKRMPFLGAALHASGALSSTVLHSLRDAGFATGSLHPLVSVSDSVSGAASLRSAFFCVEGDARSRHTARYLVSALGAESFTIQAKDKVLYHAAAVLASGHVTALFDIAAEMLTYCGLTEERARAVLLPLLSSTLENLSRSDPAHALTGTFARADTRTVRKHLQALHSFGLRDALAAYTLLGQRSLLLSAKNKRAIKNKFAALEKIARTLAAAEAGRLEQRAIADRASAAEEEAAAQHQPEEDSTNAWQGCNLVDEVGRYRGELIKRALEASGGTVTRAARLLGTNHQSLISLINGRYKELLPLRKPIQRRRRNIIRRERR
ncbi:MAG: hypothetical protein QOC96_210 [Acidobacteriota bacterium]|jgi:predicted short-subunit dehydrogenase-like oxidoreductase (DUF2520 family)|nr:hypothetical protein [Acidobacteriota bacterium]